MFVIPISIRRHTFGHLKNVSARKGFKMVLFIAKLLGLLSESCELESTVKERHAGTIAAKIYNGFLCIILFLNAVLLTRLNILKFQNDKTVIVKLEGFCHVGYAYAMFYTYFYQFSATKKLSKIIQQFVESKQTSLLQHRNHSYSSNLSSQNFMIFCIAVTAPCLLMGIIENGLYDAQKLNNKPGKDYPILQLYYIHNFNHWHVIFPTYSPIFTMMLVIIIKICTWGWVHMETICIVLFRALWERLNQLEQTVIFALSHENDKDGRPNLYKDRFEVYRQEYIAVSDLAVLVSNYITPLMLSSYIGNIYIMIVKFFNWLGPFNEFEVTSAEESLHVCFSFFQISFRVAMVTFFAAEVYQNSDRIRRKILMFPKQSFTTSLKRLETALTAYPIGICLVGSFLITRKSFAAILSFILTTEIVLLQVYSTYHFNREN